MPPIVQVTKIAELKALQQHVTKMRECQCRTTQLKEFQDIGEQLSLKAVNALQAVQESRREVTATIVEHLLEQDVEDCMGISDKIKAQVEEVQQQYEEPR